MGGVDISVRHLDKDNTAAQRCEIGASGWLLRFGTHVRLGFGVNEHGWSLLGDDRLHG